MSDESFQTVDLHNYIDRMRAGDKTASNLLVVACRRRLEVLTAKMLKRFPNVARYAEADDVFQGAALRLLRSLESLRPANTREFLALAATHIRRELLDLARHYGSRQASVGMMIPIGVGEDSSSGGFQPADTTSDQAEMERWAAFHEAVQHLPSEEREVVGLVFYHGWTQVQIAELFSVDERTIRRRWKAACLALSATLEGKLPEG
jgi:RNA polymerase sigma-70 factor (ECF subfamily)